MKGGFVVGCRELSEKLKGEIKKEYINGGITYKELAEKYNVSQKAIERIASPKKENWRALREEKAGKIEEKVLKKSIEYESDCVVLIEKTSKMLLEKFSSAIENDSLSNTGADTYSKAFDVLKKAKQVGGCKSKRELEEQIARIDKLKAETALAKSKVNGDTTDDGGITLIISR